MLLMQGTITEALVVWVADAPVPVIVNCVVLAPAVVLAVSVSVELPPAVTLAGLNLPVTPDGNPETDRAILCATPNSTAVLIV